MENRVRVGVRIRPLSQSEIDSGSFGVIREEKSRYVAVDSTTNGCNIPTRRSVYEYDWVFGPHSAQKDVYLSVCGNLISKLFDGINATVFAYGQTGSGK